MMITRASANGPSVPSTRDVFRILARQKRKMVVFFCATMTAVVGLLIVFPRTYSSEARLFVRLGKESVSLDPTATLGQTVAVNESRESEINSELEMLRSRVLLEDVVEHLGPDRILSGSTDGESSWLGTLFSPVSMVSSLLSGDVTRYRASGREAREDDRGQFAAQVERDRSHLQRPRSQASPGDFAGFPGFVHGSTWQGQPNFRFARFLRRTV